MPAAFTYAMGHDRFDWGFLGEVEPHLNHRVIEHPRGKVLGGSSSINAMAFSRGHPQDFERWAGNELPSWSYAHCLPYFKRMETFSGGASAYRGGDGPLNVTANRITHPLNVAFLQACDRAGYPVSDDTNGYQCEGVGALDQSIHEGSRMNVSRAYLRPVENRPNLRIDTNCFVTRILFEGSRAVGVEYEQGGRLKSGRADREVVLCAGAISSPRLLMLSGVGDANALRALGIDVVADRSGVGANLQDHVDVAVKVTCVQPVSDTPCLKLHNKALIGLRWLLFKTGPGATNHFEVAGFVRSLPALSQPDLAIAFVPLLVQSDGSKLPHEHGYMATVMLLRPKSRGYVKLRSNNPKDPPVILCDYLSEPDDLHGLRVGVKTLREIFAQPPFDPYRGIELQPGEGAQGDDQIDAYIRETVKSTHHLSCTCPMGHDESSVVDEEGRVHGLDGLRVVDASVMPNIASAFLNATTIMVAEKLVDRITGVTPLDPMFEEARRALAFSGDELSREERHEAL